MTDSAAAFDADDLAVLLALYNTPADGDQPRRPPWTWSVLAGEERAALGRMIDVWATTYNHIHAITPAS